VRDADENQEVVSGHRFVFPANTDMHFVAIHSPTSFKEESDGLKYSRGTVTFVRVGQMKSASFQMVTWWPRSVDDYANKDAILAQKRYPSPEYELYAQWNQDKPNNPRLIENSPDFKLVNRVVSAPKAVRPSSPRLLTVD